MVLPRRSTFRRMLRSIVSPHGSSEAIALGAAIGVFVAFTPTIGVQMVLSAFLATLAGANRPASLLGPWITNPVTIVPIYVFTYKVGRSFVPGPSVGQVAGALRDVVGSIGRMSLLAFYDHLKEFLKLGLEVLLPMLIGGAIVGLVSAAVTYPVVLVVVRRYRRLRAARRERRLARRRARHADGSDEDEGR